MAVDYYGNAVRFAHGVWEAPTNVIAGPDYTQHLNAVSCPSSAFCAATTSYGDAVVYRHGSWSQPVSLNGGGFSVSCASRSFCIAVGDGKHRALRYDGSTWSPESVPGNNALLSVSCPSRSFCVAAGLLGYAAIYRGGSWSRVPVFTKPGRFSGVVLVG